MIIMHHHENADGSGFPAHLKAERIPFPARVLHLVDSYDLLTSGRLDRPTLGASDALAALIKNVARYGQD